MLRVERKVAELGQRITSELAMANAGNGRWLWRRSVHSFIHSFIHSSTVEYSCCRFLFVLQQTPNGKHSASHYTF